MKIKAPWSKKQVEDLNDHQTNPQLHSYTCPGDHPSCKDRRDLLATPDGWICACGAYRQDWAHDYSVKFVNILGILPVRKMPSD